jgi:hypothetical protein
VRYVAVAILFVCLTFLISDIVLRGFNFVSLLALGLMLIALVDLPREYEIKRPPPLKVTLTAPAA